MNLQNKILILTTILFFIITNQALAAPTTDRDSSGLDCANQICLDNPLNNNQPGIVPVPELIGKIINISLGLVGSLALAMFIYGGFLWMMSGGNNEMVQKGKTVLIWSTIGLVIIFSSYALVKFVLESLKG